MIEMCEERKYDLEEIEMHLRHVGGALFVALDSKQVDDKDVVGLLEIANSVINWACDQLVGHFPYGSKTGKAQV